MLQAPWPLVFKSTAEFSPLLYPAFPNRSSTTILAAVALLPVNSNYKEAGADSTHPAPSFGRFQQESLMPILSCGFHSRMAPTFSCTYKGACLLPGWLLKIM